MQTEQAAVFWFIEKARTGGPWGKDRERRIIQRFPWPA